MDDLKNLWIGVETYDILRKKNFIMRVSLMWTINDFPAYRMLSGMSTLYEAFKSIYIRKEGGIAGLTHNVGFYLVIMPLERIKKPS